MPQEPQDLAWHGGHSPGTDDPGRLPITASDLSALIQAGESDTMEFSNPRVQCGRLWMIETCREAGLPEPEFAELSGTFVVTFRQSKLTREYLAGLGLSARQIAAVEYIQAHGRITNREHVALTHVARPTAMRDLADLVAKGLVQQHGRGRGSYFTLV